MRNQEINVTKIKTLTDGEFNLFTKQRTKKQIKELLNIKDSKRISIGDTAVLIGRPTNKNEVYKIEDRYYIVINPLDEKLAFCYSVY